MEDIMSSFSSSISKVIETKGFCPKLTSTISLVQQFSVSTLDSLVANVRRQKLSIRAFTNRLPVETNSQES